MIAAGGIADGVSMASAFVLGAEGVQMGTRMLASLESNVHDGLKQAIIGASETDTVLVNRHNGKPMRVLRTDTTSELEFATDGDPMGDLLMNTVGHLHAGDRRELAPLGRSGRRPHRLPAPRLGDHAPDRRGVRRDAPGARRPVPRRRAMTVR